MIEPDARCHAGRWDHIRDVLAWVSEYSGFYIVGRWLLGIVGGGGGGGDVEFGRVVEGDWERRAVGLEAVGRGKMVGSNWRESQ